MLKGFAVFRSATLRVSLIVPVMALSTCGAVVMAQAPTAAPAPAARQLGTVTAVAGNSLTLITCYPFYFIGSAPKRFIVHAKAL